MRSIGVFQLPVAAAEHRSRNREKRASCLSPRVRRSNHGSPMDFHAAERERRGSARPGCMRPASWRAPGGARVRRSFHGSPVDFHAAERVRRGSAHPGYEGRGRAFRGVVSFGDFSLDKQRKVTQGAGAEPPAIMLLNRARSAHNIDSVGQSPTNCL